MSDRYSHLLQQFYATRALDVLKMKAFIPCEVDDKMTNYRGTIAEIVFDPVHIPEVNDRFTQAGYIFDEDMQVIAVNDDESILLWGGVNSIFHLRKGETISGPFDEKHLAFQDILDLTNRFKIKNKRVEIDDLIAKMKEKYSGAA
jgi:hypothetical protein